MHIIKKRVGSLIRNFSPIFYKILLKYYFGIKSVGKNTRFSRGFKVFSGACNIFIGDNVYLEDAVLNAGSEKGGIGSIHIENFVFFGHNVMVLARGHDYKKILKERQESITESSILIKKGAWIGSRAIILGGVVIGENAVIAAGSIVTKNVEDNSVVAGNPAKFIKFIN